MTLDPRTAGNIATLDPNKARSAFASFAALAKVAALEMGCDYVMISGHRTWAEQDELYARGRTKDGPRVTNARGGWSNHNFKIAGDFGVFCKGRYLDETNPTLAEKVHKACSRFAASCGLEWGGSWQSFQDTPHYEFKTGLSLAQKRERFQKSGSVM